MRFSQAFLWVTSELWCRVESMRHSVYNCRGAACNRYYLCKLGVTHVLNAAEGHSNGTVDTDKVGHWLYQQHTGAFSKPILEDEFLKRQSQIFTITNLIMSIFTKALISRSFMSPGASLTKGSDYWMFLKPTLLFTSMT